MASNDIVSASNLADSLFSLSLSPNDEVKYYAALSRLALFAFNNSRYDISHKQAERCITFFDKHNQEVEYLGNLRISGSALVFLSEHDRAKEYLDKCSTLLEHQPELNNYHDIIKTHMHKGIMYGMQKSASMAFKEFSLADSFCHIAGDEPNQGAIAGYMGNVYAMVDQNEKAIEYLLRGKEISLKVGQDGMALAACNNAANSFNNLEKYDDALEILEEGRSIGERTNDLSGLAYNYTITAHALTLLSRLEEAEEILQKALVLHRQLNSTYGELQVYQKMCAIFQKKGDFQDVVKTGSRMLKMADSTNIVDYRTRAHFALWIAYDSLKNVDKAYHHVAWYYWLRDSTTRQNFQNQVAAQQSQFDAELKAREIELLKNEAALATEREQRKDSFNRSLTIGVAVSMLAIFTLIYFLVRLRKSSAQILHQKQALEKSDTEKAVLLKELHHRVKNNLQIVSSLLNLQSDSVKDEAAQEAFKEGQNRVDAMAMIHKHLYATDELTSVDISTYLERLVQSLAYSYGFSKRNFVLHTDIRKQPVDVDVAIPLGLIVNELVSNTFKHAFKDVAMAEITIKLRYDNDQISLLIKDNGSGLPKEFSVEDSASFGLELVQTLVHQLKGKISFENQNGAMFAIEIDQSKTMAA